MKGKASGRPGRMQTVIDFAAWDERCAARTLLNSRRATAEYETKLESLKQCRADYLAKLSGGGRSISVTDALSLRNFIEQLDTAIQQLELLLAGKRRENESQVKEWSARHKKLVALNNFVGRIKQQEQREAENREQFELDEFAQRGKGHSA